MSKRRTVEISQQQRETLSHIADVLIPAVDDRPAASEADVAGKWLDRVLNVRPDVALDLSRVLDDANGQDPAAEVERLYNEDPKSFATLSLVVTGGYYMNPMVRKLIGYPGQVKNPPYADEAGYYLEGGLLDPVTERGAIYRPTP